MSENWVVCGTCFTKTEGTELGGIEGAETGFPRSNVENKKVDKKCRNPIGTPGNSRRLGDRARMRHIFCDGNKFYLIRINFREAIISRFSRFVKNREIKDSLKLGYAEIKHAKFNTLL